MARPDNLGTGFLSEPPPIGAEALVIEVLVAEETGEVDLGALPLLAAYRFTGAAPTRDDASEAVAFEAGLAGTCGARVLIATRTLESPKDSPLRVEIDLAGATLAGPTVDGTSFCTWLPVGMPRAAGLECVSMSVEGPAGVSRARSWLRLAWTEPTTATLPTWASVALGPGATTPPGAELALEPVDGTPFVLGDSPPLPRDMPSIHAQSVAWREGGWVAAGRFDPLGGTDVSTADAPVWFSRDGLAWRRVDTPEVFGGAGYQAVDQVVADERGWWARGSSYTGPEGAMKVTSELWTSTDGETWRRVTPECAPGLGCAPGSDVTVQALATGAAAPSGAQGGLLAAGRISMALSTMWLDGEGDVTSAAVLPIPPSVPDQTQIRIFSVSGGGPAGWLIVGNYPALTNGADTFPSVAWRSEDGQAWRLLAGEAGDALAALNPTRVLDTPLGWFGVGGFGVARSADLSSWETVLQTTGGGEITTIVVHNGMLVALGYDDPARGGGSLAWSTPDGTTWSPIGVPAGAELTGGASDGTRLILVGGDRENAGVWVANLR